MVLRSHIVLVRQIKVPQRNKWVDNHKVQRYIIYQIYTNKKGEYFKYADKIYNTKTWVDFTSL